MESGTHGRTWYTTDSNNIAFSIYIKTNCKLQQLDLITIEIANTIVEIFKELYGISLEVKQPNDIVYNNKKIGGILTQTKLTGQKVKYLVIGIGINTNSENFAKEISNIASSIKKEFNKVVDNEKVILKFCEFFEKKLYERKIL